MTSITIILCILVYSTQVWAWPSVPSESILDGHQLLTCNIKDDNCFQCLESNRQLLEQFRCDCEKYRDICENFKSKLEYERQEVEREQMAGEIDSIEYKKQISNYHRLLNIEYSSCIDTYKARLFDYYRRIKICQIDTNTCAKVLKHFK